MISSLFPTSPRASLSSTSTGCISTSSAAASPRSISTARPAVILPGLGNNKEDYRALVATLKEDYGVPCVTAEVSRIDWLRNATGLLDPNYWRGTLRPRPVLDWYLKRVDEAVSEAKQLSSLDGNSWMRKDIFGRALSGGWLARLYMEEFGQSHISLLLTLGSPHLPPPKGLPGVIDQTRGLLDYVTKNCAPAVYTPELKYVCIAGRSIQGAPLFGKENANNDTEMEMVLAMETELSNTQSLELNSTATRSATTINSSTFRARFFGQGYKQVCGRADVWGDGVVPEMSAHLEGALNISLEGVYHSPVGSDNDFRPWYGSPSVLKKWVHHLLNDGQLGKLSASFPKKTN